MFTGAETTRSNMNEAAHRSLELLLRAFDEKARNACAARGIPAVRTPFGRSANFLAVIGPEAIYLVVDDVMVGGMPDHIYLDHRERADALSLEAVVGAAVQEFGFRDPIGALLPIAAFDAPEEYRDMLLTPVAIDAAAFMTRRIVIKQLDLPIGYEHYSRFLAAFLADHPEPERNVLLMMRFRTTEQYVKVANAVRKDLSQFGLQVLRANDKDYTGDLWENVCLYMLGSRFGVAVFEEIDEREFNPNIALELGFMTALNRRCLILKDRRMPRLPTDIIGKLYKEFDTYDIDASVEAAVTSWAHDLNLIRVAAG